jgi:hypothetical protein
MAKLLLAVAAVGVGALFLISCGSATGGVDSSRTSAVAKTSTRLYGQRDAPVKDVEGDFDGTDGAYYDSDDQDVIGFGHSASAPVTREIAALVKSYHEMAAQRDGPGACRLMNPVLAELVTETYIHVHVRRRTCASVLSAYYGTIHRELVAEDTAISVGDVRIGEGRGFAMVGSFGAKPRRDMPVKQYKGVWKIDDVLDTTLP